jgi:hypothetical protein
LVLEPVKNVRNRDRVVALEVDLADGGLLANVDLELHTLWRVDTLDAHIVEVACVPQRVEVALDHRLIERIPGARVQARQDRLFGNAPVADHLRLAQNLRRGRRRGKLRRRGYLPASRRQKREKTRADSNCKQRRAGRGAAEGKAA